MTPSQTRWDLSYARNRFFLMPIYKDFLSSFSPRKYEVTECTSLSSQSLHKYLQIYIEVPLLAYLSTQPSNRSFSLDDTASPSPTAPSSRMPKSYRFSFFTISAWFTTVSMSLSALMYLPLNSLAFPVARYTHVCPHSSGLRSDTKKPSDGKRK